jgi:hypothetical protein
MIGNSVSPPMALTIFSAIKSKFEDQCQFAIAAE